MHPLTLLIMTTKFHNQLEKFINGIQFIKQIGNLNENRI